MVSLSHPSPSQQQFFQTKNNTPMSTRSAPSPSPCYSMRSLLTIFLLLCITIADNVTIAQVQLIAETESSAGSAVLRDLTSDASWEQTKLSSLRGTNFNSMEHKQLAKIREKLRDLSSSMRIIDPAYNWGEQKMPHVNDEWRSRWSSLEDHELSILSRDSSFMHGWGQRALASTYLGRRRTSITVERHAALDIGGISFLRGNAGGYHSPRLVQQEKQHQTPRGQRTLSSWTVHGDVNELPSGSVVNGNTGGSLTVEHDLNPNSVAVENTEFILMAPNAGQDPTTVGTIHNTADMDSEMQDLYARLRDAMETTKHLNEKHAPYDTNSLYTYSNPGGPPIDDASVNDMVQQAAFGSDRQRLLTGSYAVWQWYDRNNLASPLNMNFTKLSRVNYAFFQTDGDGYIFGTDSWADPNVLFGPYDFSVNVDKLPDACKGGRGRDDGKPENATVDEFAIYKEQEEGITSNRRTQNTVNTDEGQGNGKNRYPDYTKDPPCEAFEQCHRNFPNSKTCNIHKYKEGLIHIAHTNGAQVYPSIGGWTLSSSFPAVAADPKKRTRFAHECVGLIADYGFDGIDIDWEYPGYAPHGGSADDRKNFNELLLAIRVALNEYQKQTGDAPVGGGAFGLTAALPCGPANIDFLDVSFLSEVLSGMNLMTFDFHNEQEPVTGVNAPLYDQGWGEAGLSVDGCVKNYFQAGAASVANKISIGVPFYGKTYSYATELNGPHSNTNGLYGGEVDQANWPQDLGTPVFYNMLDTMIKGTMVCKRHEPSKTEYAYFKDGSGLVTYDDPQAVCDKAEYVNQNLLGGLFIWELSGDLLKSYTAPLLDTINRKLEEINFDCSIISTPEDCTLIELPPPASKGAAQIEASNTTNITEAILAHLEKAEAGELTTVGSGFGTFTRTVFMMRTYDGSLFPSYTYRYDHFVEALGIMATTGVNGEVFYLGQIASPGERGVARQLQARNTSGKETSLVYGLVNIAVFLAQAMTESIIFDACDEINVQPLPNSTDDGKGLDDGFDHFRFPISNACGQNGRSYQDEQCKRTEDSIYDCATQLNIEDFVSMEVTAFSHSLWRGAPAPFYCGPKSSYKETGFWNAATGRENDTIPLANDDGRTNVESCCWWGRGCLLSVKGTCLLGKLNYHIGANKARRDGRSAAMFPDVDFCLDPGQICAGLYSTRLRWISGMYHWVENVQSYDEDGFNYLEELGKYVRDNLEDGNFFTLATKVHLFGCHLDSCTQQEVEDMDSRVRNFEKILSVLNLQFTSYAKAEPPFKTFPGQVPPTAPPVLVSVSKSPTGSPVSSIENIFVQVKVFLTGVPPQTNMTNAELNTFDTLMLELLVPRLKTANVDVTAVKTVEQKTGSDFVADTKFDTKNSDSASKSVLEVLINVTLSYNPPPPDGWRDWSIYLKSWIESFGNTLVDIFTSPQNPQHPETNSKFWDDLTDISAANVPPRRDFSSTEFPTSPPTYIVYPAQSATNQAIIGLGIGVGCLSFCLLIGFGCYKVRKSKQESLKQEKTDYYNDPSPYEFSKHPPYSERQSRGSGYNHGRRSRSSGQRYHAHNKLLENIKEESESESSGDSDSSNGSSSDSSDKSSSSNSSSNSSSSSSKESYSSEKQISSELKSFVSNSQKGSTKSEATDSMNSIDDDEQEYIDITKRAAANDPTLKQIVLDNKKTIGYRDGGDRLWNSLVNNHYVNRLSLRNSNIDDAQLSSLSLALVDNSSISELWLENNNISSEGAEFLISTLESNNTIDEVRLDGNHIDARVTEDITLILKKKSISAHGKDNLGSISERLMNNDPSLQRLTLSGMNIGSRNDTLFDALAENTHLRALDLSSNEIDDDCASSLSLALMENKSICHLNLSNNFLTSDGAEYLIGLLDTNSTLKSINLDGNDIEDGPLREIENILKRRHITTSSSTSQGSQSPLVGVVQSLQMNDPSLVELCLDGLDLTDCPETEAMIDALLGNVVVKRLSLNSTCFDDTLVASLSLSLVENSTITHIMLRDNLITNEGCEYLLGTLDSNTTVLHLDLSNNYIDQNLLDEIDSILSSSERESVAKSSQSKQASEEVNTNEVNKEMKTEVTKRKAILAVMSNTSLEWTEKNRQILQIKQEYHTPNNNSAPLSETASEDQGVKAIISKIRDNDPGLTEVNLDDMNLSKADEMALLNALTKNSFVTSISLQRNKIGDDGAAELCKALENNSSLISIDLSENEITSKAALSIISVLKDSNQNLQYLDLKHNRVRSGLLSQLEKVLEERRPGSVSSASVSLASRMSAVASAFMRRSASTSRAKKGSAKIAGKEIV